MASSSECLRTAILLGAGLIAGFINAIAGGGTIITFPALIFAGMSPVIANTTSTVALLPGALGGVFGYRHNLAAASRWIRLFAGVSAAGGLIGGALLLHTSAALFAWLAPFLVLFATLLFTLNGILSGLQRRRSVDSARFTQPRWVACALLFQFAVAIYGGYFGAGIGILMLASLGILGVENIHEMNTVKGALGFLINCVAAVYFAWSGFIQWPGALLMAAGSVAGGYGGARLAQKIPQKVVRNLVTLIGFMIAGVMYFRQRV